MAFERDLLGIPAAGANKFTFCKVEATGAGTSYGSINTTVIQLPTVRKSSPDVVFTNSSTLGGQATITNPGLYSIELNCEIGTSGGGSAGLAINCKLPTTSIQTLTDAQGLLAVATTSSTSGRLRACTIHPCNAGDYIWAMSDGSTTINANENTFLKIVRIS